MQVIIKNYKLIELLKKISGAVVKDKNRLILSNVLLKILNNKIFCIAINDLMEIVTYDFLETNYPNMEFIIEYDLLYNITRKLDKNTDVIIKKDRKYIEIFANDSIFKIYREFDVFPSFQFDNKNIFKFKIDNCLLLKILKNVKISISDNNVQRFLNGILFDINNNCLNVLSSDGVRLSYFNFICYEFTDIPIKSILPKALINEIINIFIVDSFTNVIISNNQIKFISEKITLTSKLVEDIYNIPDIYLDLNENIVLKLNTIDTLNALEKLIIIKSIDDKAIFFISNNKIIIKSGNFIQNVTIFLNIDVKYNNIELALNYKHFRDIVKLLEGDIFYFILSNNKSIIIIKEINSNNLHIMMPFKI